VTSALRSPAVAVSVAIDVPVGGENVV
jgi:hypothetical protein